jgi:hypothetical protein
MTVFLIGAMHGLPVFLAALVFGTRKALYIAAAIMAVVAGAFGNPSYIFVDWIGVAIGTMLGMLALKGNQDAH